MTLFLRLLDLKKEVLKIDLIRIVTDPRARSFCYGQPSSININWKLYKNVNL